MTAFTVVERVIRRDFLTSAAIDHALRMQRRDGTETARRYLVRTCIRLDIVERVLMTSCSRLPR